MYSDNKFAKMDSIANLVKTILETDTKVKMEELKGAQHKIDKNKNNKIDAQDFAILRGEKKAMKKEESEQVEEAYKGKNPHHIKTISSGGAGKIVAITNAGARHEISAKDTGGKMPKTGEHIGKYVKIQEEQIDEGSWGYGASYGLRRKGEPVTKPKETQVSGRKVKGKGYDSEDNDRKAPEGNVPMTSLMPGHDERAAKFLARQVKGRLVKGKAQSAKQVEKEEIDPKNTTTDTLKGREKSSKDPFLSKKVMMDVPDNVNEEKIIEGWQITAKTKEGETFKSGIHPTKEKAMSMHYKMSKSGNFKNINLVKMAKEEVEQVVEAEAGISAKKENKFHTKLDKLVHKTFGASSDEKKMKKEESEQNVAEGNLGAEFASFAKQKGIKATAPMTKAQSDTALKARAEKFKKDNPTPKQPEPYKEKYPLGGRDEKSGKSYSEEVEQVVESDPRKSGTFERQPDGSFKMVSNLEKLKRRLAQKHGDKLKKKISEEQIDEKSVSQAQQKFMGMVYAAKKGMKPASPEVAKAAKTMTTKAARDFAKTKHAGLPKHVSEAVPLSMSKKPKMTALEKFTASLKKAGYDPEERAKKMNALLDKHRKEREEMEKKYPHIYGENK